jgi:hypothetical protein
MDAEAAWDRDEVVSGSRTTVAGPDQSRWQRPPGLMTAEPGSFSSRVLDKYFGGERDPVTFRLTAGLAVHGETARAYNDLGPPKQSDYGRQPS